MPHVGEEVETWRRGDLVVPVGEVAPPVHLGLGNVEEFVEIGIGYELVEGTDPGCQWDHGEEEWNGRGDEVGHGGRIDRPVKKRRRGFTV